MLAARGAGLLVHRRKIHLIPMQNLGAARSDSPIEASVTSLSLSSSCELSTAVH